MSDISLTASMRSNLLSLQNTQSLMDMTQERLSTGKKVNSAIDNPSSYYAAQSLTNRADDLSALLDSMGQAIQTIKAADEGIETITTFAQQAKAVAQSAADSADKSEREAYEKQFNEILKQIDDVAKDSNYKGINLLGGTTNKLTVKFNEKTDSNSKLDIVGVDASTKGDANSLNIADAADWDKVSDDIATLQGAVTTKKADYEAAPNDSGAKAAYENAVAALEAQQAADLAAQNTAIANSISAVEAAITKLRSWSSEFGNNYSIVQSREDFTERLINVLTEGADKLTLADMNEESANMLALQTRQQLAINSLSLASQASQSVLKLF
ncbi:MAG: flagellin [Alphaproteobacteria bacterium]|nr:flagellin [Alphaproteobacteria bacterium]